MRWLAALIIFLLPGIAAAQAISCQLPAKLPPSGPVAPEERRIVAIGGYTLALSWSPEYCRTRRSDPDDRFQCNGPVDRFGFVLHGLWPDGNGDLWPQYCRPVGAVPEAVARATLCVTPSVQMLQHEWAKHGVCAFAEPAAYFTAGRALYGAIRYPDMDALSRNRNLRAASFAAAFVARNPGLRTEAIRLRLNRRGWLEEIYICLDRRFRIRACPGDNAARDQRPVKIWPAAR